MSASLHNYHSHSSSTALKYGLGVHLWDIPVSRLTTKAAHVRMIQPFNSQILKLKISLDTSAHPTHLRTSNVPGQTLPPSALLPNLFRQ